MELGDPAGATALPLLCDDGQPERGAHTDSCQKLTLAQEAYHHRDVGRARELHERQYSPGCQHAPQFERHAGASSDYLKALIFGGLDGVITIFAVVAGCVGARLTPMQTLIVGAGNVVADAVSMGFGEYVSAKAENDLFDNEKQRELWEVENVPEGEKQEMLEIYQHKYNFSPEDARTMVDIAFRYKDFYISHMMAEELGLLCSRDGPSPRARGMAMFTAFVIFGLVPLTGFGGWSYYSSTIPTMTEANVVLGAFWSAALSSCVTLYILGALKGSFIGTSPWKAGVQMMLNGAIAGGVAYGIGVALESSSEATE